MDSPNEYPSELETELLTMLQECLTTPTPQSHMEALNAIHDCETELYPFTAWGLLTAPLLAEGTLSYQDYLRIYKEYRSRNIYLPLFHITAPRTFGETWCQKHLRDLVPELLKPSKTLDPSYDGNYDLWLDGIRIEVKASRAVLKRPGGSLISKALASGSPEPYEMNFQQIKPAEADVFIFVAVWRDKIRYWVLSSQDIRSNPYYIDKMHRGNKGEGQLWFKSSNLHAFDAFECSEQELLNGIRKKGPKPPTSPRG